jgi:uncharacterized HAD superfamily protein
MLIAVDIDETCIKFLPYFLRWHNGIHGTSLKLTDMNDFDMSEKLGCTTEECSDRILEFYDTKLMRQLSPVERAVEKIDYLSEKHDIVAITARPESIKHITQNSIDKYFRHSIEKLYLTGDGVGESEKSKAEICQEYGVDVLIDDRPKYCYEAIEVGTAGILFNLNGNYGWGNSEVKKEGLYHAQSWKEIVETIGNI